MVRMRSHAAACGACLAAHVPAGRVPGLMLPRGTPHTALTLRHQVWREKAAERRRLGIGPPLRPSAENAWRLEQMYDDD